MTKPEALRLADEIDAEIIRTVQLDILHQGIANELRRLYVENEKFKATNIMMLERIGFRDKRIEELSELGRSLLAIDAPAGAGRQLALYQASKDLNAAIKATEKQKLEWTESRPPCEEVRYDHCIAATPFGRFLLTWKGWKKHDPVCAEETPWNDFFRAFDTLEEAKAECEAEYFRRILSTFPQAQPTMQELECDCGRVWKHTPYGWGFRADTLEQKDSGQRHQLTQEQTIRLAREAGIGLWELNDEYCDAVGLERGTISRVSDIGIEELERFTGVVGTAQRVKLRDEIWDEIWDKAMKLVGEATKLEREACATVCEGINTNGDGAECWLEVAADAVRSRGKV